MGLSSKVAIVTGSARGIGRAIALKLSQAGAIVVVSDREPGDAVVAEIKALGGKAVFFSVDITKAAEVSAVVAGVLSRLGRIDILVNNAGIVRDQLLLRMSEEDWDAVLAVNLKGAFLCTKAVLRHMIKQRWGRIVNISSVVGIMGNAGQANYCSAKAGLIGLTRATAKEVASRGITVNGIAPGFIDTEMTRRLDESLRQEIQKQIPVGYFGSPEDVAQAVAFLASEEARYITGQVLTVDGGLLMA